MKITKHILTAIMLMAGASAMAMPAGAEAPQVESIDREAPRVHVHAGKVSIELPGTEHAHVVVYALTGQVVKQFDAEPGTTTVELPSGYYIVRIGQGNTVKIAVK